MPREVGPLLGELVLGEARVDRACLDARVAVDALLRVDVEHLDLVVVGLVGRRVDAVDRADLHAGVVLGPDAGLGDDVGHGAASSDGMRALLTGATGLVGSRCCGASPRAASRSAAWSAIRAARARARAGPDHARRPGRPARVPPRAARRRAPSSTSRPRTATSRTRTIEELDGHRDLAAAAGGRARRGRALRVLLARSAPRRTTAAACTAPRRWPSRRWRRPRCAPPRFAPSLVYAPGDRRLARLERLACCRPCRWPAAAARARSRSGPRTSPTACWRRSTARRRRAHARYELAGPDVLTHREVVELALRAAHRRRRLRARARRRSLRPLAARLRDADGAGGAGDLGRGRAARR